MVLDRLKGVMAVESRLDDLKKKIKDHTKATKEQSEELASFKSEVGDVKRQLNKLIAEGERSSESMNKQLDAIKDLRDGMKKELYDLKLLKTTIQSRLVSELSEDFRKELQKSMHKLDTDVRTYNDLRDTVAQIAKQLTSVTVEIQKFKQISQDVKAADFEMAKHAREVAKSDAEKRNLLQRIEHLETLIAKERRKNRYSR